MITKSPIHNEYGTPQVEKRNGKFYFQLGQRDCVNEVEVSTEFYNAFVLEFQDRQNKISFAQRNYYYETSDEHAP